MTTPVLSPKMTALRDLVLHALATSKGGEIRSTDGFVARRIVELCGIPDTLTNRGNVSMILGALESQDIITRDHRAPSKRTYAAILTKPLTEARIAQLQRDRETNRNKFLPKEAQQAEVTSQAKEEESVVRIVADLLVVLEDREAQIAYLTRELEARGWTPGMKSSTLDRARAVIEQHRSEKR